MSCTRVYTPDIPSWAALTSTMSHRQSEFEDDGELVISDGRDASIRNGEGNAALIGTKRVMRRKGTEFKMPKTLEIDGLLTVAWAFVKSSHGKTSVRSVQYTRLTMKFERKAHSSGPNLSDVCSCATWEVDCWTKQSAGV
eukprot:2501867-Pleurochrysis_carterae.AAC.1